MWIVPPQSSDSLSPLQSFSILRDMLSAKIRVCTVPNTSLAAFVNGDVLSGIEHHLGHSVIILPSAGDNAAETAKHFLDPELTPPISMIKASGILTKGFNSNGLNVAGILNLGEWLRGQGKEEEEADEADEAEVVKLREENACLKENLSKCEEKFKEEKERLREKIAKAEKKWEEEKERLLETIAECEKKFKDENDELRDALAKCEETFKKKLEARKVAIAKKLGDAIIKSITDI